MIIVVPSKQKTGLLVVGIVLSRIRIIFLYKSMLGDYGDLDQSKRVCTGMLTKSWSM